MSIVNKFSQRKKITIDVGNKVSIALIGINNWSSYLAYELSQIASLSEKRINIIFADNGIVDTDNLINGKFIANDFEINRARVTQERCSAAFDINIETYEKEFRDKNNIIDLFKGKMGYFPILVCNSNDTKKMEEIKGAVKVLPDVVVFTVDKGNDTCDIRVTYKKDGYYVLNNLDETSHTDSDAIIDNKSKNIEISKNLFLYLDDILCDRQIATECTRISFNNKTTASKYIEGNFSMMKSNEAKASDRKINIGDDVLVIVIGLGGTGASVAYDIAHRASSSDKNIKIIFIDGDIVEAGNLNRQRFIIEDLGKFKASVTANRCSDAYDVDIESVTDYIENADEIYDILKKNKGFFPIILGCSDSLKLRFLVSEALKNIDTTNPDLPKECVYIDAGNDIDAGQVICTHIKNGECITPDFFSEFPGDLEDVEKAKLVTELSCDELMVSAPQTKGANISAATGIYSFFESIISEENINAYMIQFGIKNKIVTSKQKK